MIYSIMKPMYFPSLNFIWNLINSDVFISDEGIEYKYEYGIMKIDKKEYKIPVLFKKGDKYSEVEICNVIDWQGDHYKAIIDKYKDAPYYDKYIDIFTTLYCKRSWKKLSDFNRYFLEILIYRLKITADIYYKKSDIRIGGGIYLKNYKEKINRNKFEESGIMVTDVTTKEGEKSILDLMFYKDLKC